MLNVITVGTASGELMQTLLNTSALSSAKDLVELTIVLENMINATCIIFGFFVVGAAIARQWKEFGSSNMGVEFMLGVVIVLALFYSGPRAVNAVHKSMSDWYMETSNRAEVYTYNLIEKSYTIDKNGQEGNNEGSHEGHEKSKGGGLVGNFLSDTFNGLKAWFTTAFYTASMAIGTGIRDLFYFFMKMLFRGMLLVMPLFLGFLVFPELRSIAVSFLTTLMAFCLMPLCFIFGDILMISMTNHVAMMLGLGAAMGLSNAALGVAAVKTTVAGAAAGPVIVTSAILGLIAFGIMFVIVSIICYIVVPLSFFRLFKSGSASLAGLGGALMAGGSSLGSLGKAAPGAVAGAAGAGRGITSGVNALGNGMKSAGQMALGAAKRMGSKAK